jgi:hypothetical protein
VVANGTADAGTITMTGAKGLAATAFVVSQSADEKRTQLDVFVQNDGTQPVAVTSVRVQGMRKKETTCLDSTPGLQFIIVDQLWAGRVAAQIEQAKAADSVSANGNFLQLGCDQQQIDITVPYPFSLDPGERTKLRVAVPSVLRSSQQAGPVTVRLDEFALISMTLNPDKGPAVVVKREIVVPDEKR